MDKFIFQNGFNASTCDALSKLNDSDNGIIFGSVAINNKYAVIGDPYDSTNHHNQATAYIIKYNNITHDWNSYNETQKIYASDAKKAAQYGYSVSIFENYIIIGTGGIAGNNKGNAYILKCCNESEKWYELLILIGDEIDSAEAHFGYSVAIYNNFAMVGDPFNDAGVSHVFKKDVDNFGNETWNLSQILRTSTTESDQFGVSISISDKYAIIGAQTYSNDMGSAYIFKLDNYNNTNNNGMTWNQSGKLVPSDGSSNMHFGRSVSIDSNSGNVYAIVGAYKVKHKKVQRMFID